MPDALEHILPAGRRALYGTYLVRRRADTRLRSLGDGWRRPARRRHPVFGRFRSLDAIMGRTRPYAAYNTIGGSSILDGNDVYVLYEDLGLGAGGPFHGTPPIEARPRANLTGRPIASSPRCGRGSLQGPTGPTYSRAIKPTVVRSFALLGLDRGADVQSLLNLRPHGRRLNMIVGPAGFRDEMLAHIWVRRPGARE